MAMTAKQAQAKAVKEFGPPGAGSFWLERYVPNYKGRCEVCGQAPTVDGTLYGVTVVSTGMCGPCTWGEAACLDPGVWNDPVD